MNTKKLTDKELLNELQQRFSDIKNSLDEHALLLKKLKSVNAKLKESEEVKTQFLSNIRNEINNPLSAILALSESITSTVKLDVDTVRTGVQLIHDEAFNLDFQLKNIFLAAEIEAGETQPFLSNVNIHELIGNLIDNYASVLEHDKVKVIVKDKGLGDNTLFRTDPEKLYAILSNLFHNAIEYGGRESQVTMLLNQEDGVLKISIKDTGIGIESTELGSIFDRFKQLESGTMKKYAGHGLGLSIVKSLIDIMEGEIIVESEVGYGSKFSIKLKEGTAQDQSCNYSSDGNELLFDVEGYSEEEVF